MDRKAPPRGARAGVKADLKAAREDGQAGFAAGVTNHDYKPSAIMLPCSVQVCTCACQASTVSTMFHVFLVVQVKAQQPGRMTFSVRSFT